MSETTTIPPFLICDPSPDTPGLRSNRSILCTHTGILARILTFRKTEDWQKYLDAAAPNGHIFAAVPGFRIAIEYYSTVIKHSLDGNTISAHISPKDHYITSMATWYATHIPADHYGKGNKRMRIE